MTPLDTILRNEIHHSPVGWISFERFMSQALYHPEHGYYARAGAERQVGRGGDFITSVSVGPLFGRLLARRLASWWNELGRPSPFDLVEAGGLDGRLAGDILQAMTRDAPECFKALRYTLVEPLPRLQDNQRQALALFSNVRWAESLREMESCEGVIFGNELFDAFPIRVWESGEEGVREWGVGEKDGSTEWKAAPDVTTCTGAPPSAWRGRFEECLPAVRWLGEATRILRRGRLLLLDYGWTDEEYFEVNRLMGTLRGYRCHKHVESLLANPGEQDLTAHVRWTPLQREAVRLGWREEEFVEQGRWLTRVFAKEPVLSLNPREIRQFQTLTHPSMLGAPFRVMVFAKG